MHTLRAHRERKEEIVDHTADNYSLLNIFLAEIGMVRLDMCE